MNIGRFMMAVGGVWLVRVILNTAFYTQIAMQEYQRMTAAHPGLFREVIPAYFAVDLIFAVVFTFLLAKVGVTLGKGIKGGVVLGVIVAILSAVLGNLYGYFTFTFLSLNLVIMESAFHVVAYSIEGAVGSLLLKIQATS
ncbi:MAG: hypothetical protein AB1898_07135 [Acidobacteriota bacterium]